ncbi:MAG: outer membrane protein assembly factor BamB family protein [Acidobacteriota bacterium]
MTAVVLGLAAPGAAVTTQPAASSSAAERLIALDPRWTVSFDSAPAALAGYDQQTAYIPLKGGELVAVALADGETLWKVPLVTASTPATGDGLVFADAEGGISALDQRTGRTVWHVPLPGALAAPLYWDTGWLLASTGSGELIALRAEDGQRIWQQSLGSPLAVSPTPGADRLYVALSDRRLAALELATGSTVWSVAFDEVVTGILALDDQLLVASRSNRVHSVSLDRGRVGWSQRTGADVAGAPVADDRLIYFAALDNLLRALHRRSGNLAWIRKLPSRPTGRPLRAGNLVLVPLVTTDIAAYSAETGAEAFTIRAVGELGGVPFLREDTRPTAPLLVAMSRAGALQGFAPRIEPPPAPLAALPGVKVTGP